MIDSRRIVNLMQILLTQLEQTLEAAPVQEDSRSNSLKSQIAGYKDKAQRLKRLLQRHKAHERRKREIERQNSR